MSQEDEAWTTLVTLKKSIPLSQKELDFISNTCYTSGMAILGVCVYVVSSASTPDAVVVCYKRLYVVFLLFLFYFYFLLVLT